MDDLPRPGQSARDDDFAENADQDYEFIDGVGDEDQDGQDGESGDDLYALLNVSKTVRLIPLPRTITQFAGVCGRD